MKRSIWIAFGITGAVVAGLCLACLLGALVILGSGDAVAAALGQDHVLLRLPDHDGSSDLALLRLGQPLERAHVLAQGVDPAAAALYRQQDGRLQTVGNAQFGGFVPGTSFLLIQYELDGETHLDHVRLRTGMPSPVLETSASLHAVVLDDGSILLGESTGTRQRCYRWRSGAQAERLARGDECLVSRDGSTLVVADRSDRGLTVTASGIDGSDAVTLLEQERDVESFLLSADGSRLAYVRAREDGLQQVIVLNRRDGSTLYQSDAFVRIADYEFAPTRSALFIVAETEELDLVLYALDGEVYRVAQGPGLAAAFGPRAESLVYLIADEGGSGTLFVHPMAGGEDIEVVRGEGLSFAILPSAERILILDQVEDEIALYSADIDGHDLVELFNDTGLAGAEAFVVAGEPWLYMLLTNVRGDHALYFSPLDRAAGRMLLEDYNALLLLNRSPRASSVLVAAREDSDDELGLYRLATDGRSQPSLLDDDLDDIRNAAFTRNGRQVIYTAVSGPDDLEVRHLPANGGTPETLYQDAALLDIRWDRLAPFSDAALTFQAAQVVTSFCPGARPIRPGESLEGTLSPGAEECYRLRLDEAADLAFAVRAEVGIDTVVAVYDRVGSLIGEDDDSGPGVNPRLHLSLDAPGTYFIVVRGYSAESAGRFTLTVSEYEIPEAQQQARPLLANERVRGVITVADELYLEPYDAYLYGILYAFQAQPNDWAEIEVRAGSIGSSLRPIVILLDQSFETIAYGEPDDAGDARLTYLVTEGGRYYALVASQDEDYGSQGEYFFDITLSLGTPPEPGGGTIGFGQTVEGWMRTPAGDRWLFEGRAGDIVTIRMESDRLDCYLELLDPAGRSVASDDDSGGNRNAFLNGVQLPVTGEYTIVARGFGGGTGPYALSLTRGQITSGGGTISPGQTVSGLIVLPSGDEWTFHGTAGQRVTISMSGDFDTYLELRGPDGELLITDDDSGGNLQALISDFALPESGSYTIIARGFGRESGLSYTLRLE